MQFNWNFLGRWTGNTASYDCGRVQSLLSLYVDSMTSRVERDAIDAHLEGCEACREQSECLRSIHRVVSSRPIAEPPSDLKMRIAQAIAAERTPVRPAPRLRLSYGVLAGACSVVLCLAVAGQRYANYLAAQKPGTAVKTMVAVNPVKPVVNSNTVKHAVKSPAVTHVDTTKVATRVAPDKDVVSPESIRTRIHPSGLDVASIPKPAAHVHEAPITAPVLVAIKPAVNHPSALTIHTMKVATGNTGHPSTNHAAPPVINLPHTDVTPPSNVTPTPPPSNDQTPPSVVVASAGTTPHSMVHNADLLGSVREHLGQFKMTGQVQTPFTAVHNSLQGNAGTVNIVGSPFN